MRFIHTALIIICCVTKVLAANNGTYAFVAGSFGSGVIEAYSMDDAGSISLSTTFDIWSAYQKFNDPAFIAISPKGDALFLNDFDWSNGALYKIDDSMRFTPAKRISNGCLGGGFTWDGKYVLTTSNADLTPPKPTVQIFEVNGGAFNLAKEQEVPTSATLSRNFFCSTRDEIFSSAFVGFLPAPPAIVNYKLNRSNLSLDLKQYTLTSNRINHPGADNSRDIIVDSGGWHKITSFCRNENGMYEQRTEFTIMPGWESAWGFGACVTPDGQYSAAVMFDDHAVLPNHPAGVYLFKLTPSGELVYQSYFFQKASEVIGMTPDGKYIVVSSNYGTVVTVFRINRTTNQMEVVHTMPHPQSRMSCMAFFPNKRPKMPANEKAWPLYGKADSTASPPQKIAQTPPPPGDK